MHEIVTLQFGNQSNYLGTHFWNAQESYFTYSGDEESPVDHDIHFRSGLGADGSDTFTPRTVIYDLKDNFGTLRQTNALYELERETNPAGLWQGNPIVQQHPAIPPHDYQVHLDSGLPAPPISPSTVRFWSDYNRLFYHPRSLVQLHIPTSHLQISETQLSPFDRWDVGEDLFKTEDQEHDLLDRDLRPFIEECDQMQGLQVITGADDAWAGFAGKYVERIRDEFGRKSVWVWGLEESRDVSREKRLSQLINSARSFQELASQASLYIPVSNTPSRQAAPYLAIDTSSMWHTSALQVSALESATLASRLKVTTERSRTTLDDIENIFTAEARRNILHLELSAKDPDAEDNNGMNGAGTQPRDSRMVNGTADYDDTPAEPENLDIDLFRTAPSQSRRQNRTHTFARMDILRGSWPLDREVEDAEDAHRRARPQGQQVQLQQYTTPLLLPLPSSYPSIFEFPSHRSTEEVAVHAALSSSTAVADRMRYLADIVRRSVGVEEREGLRADLLTMAEEYVEGWEEGSSEDDD